MSLADGSNAHPESRGSSWPEWVQSHCPAFVNAASSLRHAADMAVSAVTAAADSLPGIHEPRLGRLVAKGEHLEHFHRYEVAERAGVTPGDASRFSIEEEVVSEVEQDADTPPTLALHTDAGLLLVMSPGLWMAAANGASAQPEPVLEVQLPDSRTMAVTAPKGAVLVLIGQGMADWLPEYGFRAVPHALRLSRAGAMSSGATVRAWYGRMIFPPPHFSLGRGEGIAKKGSAHQDSFCLSPRFSSQKLQLLELCVAPFLSSKLICMRSENSTRAIKHSPHQGRSSVPKDPLLTMLKE